MMRTTASDPHATLPSISLATEQSMNTPETSVRVARAGDAKLTGSTWKEGGDTERG